MSSYLDALSHDLAPPKGSYENLKSSVNSFFGGQSSGAQALQSNLPQEANIDAL